MWRLLELGYRHEGAMIVASFALALASALPAALLALWIKWLGEGLVAGDRRAVLVAALLMGGTATATWFLGLVYSRVQRRFRDRVTIALEAHVARLQATIPTLAHQERPAHLDRLSVLRDQVFVLDHMYMSLFSTCGWILRLAVAVGLLVSVHPALALLLVFALPTVLTSTWRPGIERATEERAAPAGRLARHLFVLATTAPPGKEVRVTGIGSRLVSERRDAWERWYGPVSAVRWTSAAWHALGWAVFGAAYVGAIVFVSSGLRASTGDVLLTLAAGARLSAYLSATVGEIGFLRGIWLDGSRRLAWLEDYAATQSAAADLPAPKALRDGLRLEKVSFAYPGTDRLVLDSVDLDLPAGSVVALVGENGAGKSTLVKLLTRLYEPTAGRILVDGVPLSRVHIGQWRSRLGGAFQDFFRFELPARLSVGLGDVARLDDDEAVRAAVERGGAGDVVDRTPRRPRDATRPGLARRRRRLVRPVAEDRPRPRLHARAAAPARPRRAHRRARRRDRARSLRALRGGGPRGGRGRRDPADHSPRLAPVQHRARRRPHRRPRRRTGGRLRLARGADGARRDLRPALLDPGRGIPLRPAADTPVRRARRNLLTRFKQMFHTAV